MKALGDILKYKSRQTPLMKGVIAAQAVEAANKFIFDRWGQTGAELAQAAYLKNGVMHIGCLNSIMAQEMRLAENDFLTAINKVCGSGMVQKIRYLS